MRQQASLLATSIEALEDVGDEHDRQPSPAAPVLEELSDPVCGSGVHLALSAGRAYMIAADEGMRVLAQLLVRPTPTAFTAYPVARTVIEALSRAHWLYEADLGASGRTRRGLAVLIEAIRQRLALPVENRTHVHEALEILEDRASECQVELTRKKGIPTGVLDLELPSTRQFVELLFDDKQLGSSVYWTFSDLAHANVAALLRHLEGDEAGPVLRVDERDVRLLVASTLNAWWNTTGRLTHVMAWRTATYDERKLWVNRNVALMLEPLRTA